MSVGKFSKPKVNLSGKLSRIRVTRLRDVPRFYVEPISKSIQGGIAHDVIHKSVVNLNVQLVFHV
ncbi:MAG: hypothetical protein ACRD51_07825 [Candidatus Acidiferrum sp.]